MKRVGIDCRFAGSDTGLGRYTRELTTYLLKREDGLAYTVFVRSKDEPWLRGISNATIVEAAIPHYSFAEQTTLPRLLLLSRVNLLFSPHFNVPYACPVPFVVTIHDLILHRYPNHASKLRRLFYRFLMRRSVTKAKGIIAVSDFTAGELAREYGNRIAAKTTVIREGVHERFVPASVAQQERVRRKYDLRRPFFLYVGNAKEHKNVPLLMEAFAGLGGDLELVLAMNGPEAMKLTLPSRVSRITKVPEADLIALYSSALSFVTASAYEGFCLPVAEAQACGCRVIASNKGAIPEVAGPSAVLVEPTVDALRDAMAAVEDISKSEPFRLGWEDAAREVATVCETVS
ncbi:MAG: glycosyltransferase family 1 protein [Candidatus Peribacteraceae bacterium]|nr:glycosyltransferase family 1 protein [Candidatus Peribacteraceae bacterium]